jgi:hypothetical protein
MNEKLNIYDGSNILDRSQLIDADELSNELLYPLNTYFGSKPQIKLENGDDLEEEILFSIFLWAFSVRGNHTNPFDRISAFHNVFSGAAFKLPIAAGLIRNIVILPAKYKSTILNILINFFKIKSRSDIYNLVFEGPAFGAKGNYSTYSEAIESLKELLVFLDREIHLQIISNEKKANEEIYELLAYIKECILRMPGNVNMDELCTTFEDLNPAK